jgi:8-demethyl-8-alpha-L-rhamnosyltetracenomycin-C 2'-O-methyltransferase
MTSLEILADKYALDKSISTKCHNYIPGYTTLFEEKRYSAKNVLEIGIGSVENGQMSGVVHLGYRTGNSLRCWRDYFVNANIHGIDIFPHELNETRITTYTCDQSSSKQLDEVLHKINSPIDIIIDDGSHRLEHQVFSFLHLEKHLSTNGIYVIEDIQPAGIDSFKNLSVFDETTKAYILNNYYIAPFDTRHILNRADDFMIAFIKK